MHSRTTQALLTIAVAATLAGCDSRPAVPTYGGPDGQRIARRVSDFNDDVSNPKKMAASFATGALPAKPAETKRYSSYMYQLAGDPSVSGATATAPVKLREHRSGEERGPLEWTFVKEGDAWKIKSAPLP
jgi:hypothetical protein